MATAIFLIGFSKDAINTPMDFFFNPLLFLFPLLTAMLIILVGGFYFIPNNLQEKERTLIDTLTQTFELVYAKELITSAAEDTYRYSPSSLPFASSSLIRGII